MAAITLQLHEQLAPLDRISLRPGELPALRRAVLSMLCPLLWRVLATMLPAAGVLRLDRQHSRPQKRAKDHTGEKASIGMRAHRSSTTLTISATSRPPSCLLVTLTTQPGLRSARVAVCSTKPVLPGSAERVKRTMRDAGLMSTVTSRVLPLAVASSVTVWATGSMV